LREHEAESGKPEAEKAAEEQKEDKKPDEKLSERIKKEVDLLNSNYFENEALLKQISEANINEINLLDKYKSLAKEILDEACHVNSTLEKCV